MRLVTKSESPEERAERITAELRAATSEAAGLLKDLKAVQRAARAQVDEYAHDEVSRALNEAAEQWGTELTAYLESMRDTVTSHVTQWTGVVQNEVSKQKIIDAAAARVLAELTRMVQDLHAERQPGVLPLFLGDIEVTFE